MKRNVFLEVLPIKRLIHPDEVAWLCEFLSQESPSIMHGTPSFRKAIAEFMQGMIQISEVNPANIVVSSDASAILVLIS